jgi:uncharacterized protein (TIGR02996 family)
VAVLEIRHRAVEVSLHGLDVIARDRYESWVRLPAGAVTFGRSPVLSPHIQVDTETASRRHAAFEPHGRGYAVHDLGSSGGTFLNNGEDRATVGSPHILQDGDVVFLGGPGRAATARFYATAPIPAILQPIEVDLLAAIRERVDGADTVYADWLDEQGHGFRAALIRACIALDREPPRTQEFWSAWRLRDALSDRADIGWRLRWIAARGLDQ